MNELPGPAAFPSTRWSRILGGGPDLDALARAYWRPIHAWLHARGARAADDAGDATQDFFVWMIESGFVSRADPARGRFRAFLKTALRHFAIDRDRRRRAAKRGGELAARSLEVEDASTSALEAVAAAPDEALDAAWRAETVERASARLEEELRVEGKETTFRVFRDYFLADDGVIDYRALAQRHGLRPENVSNHLMSAKRRFRALLREAVRETVGSASDLEDEIRWLLSGGAP